MSFNDSADAGWGWGCTVAAACEVAGESLTLDIGQLTDRSAAPIVRRVRTMEQPRDPRANYGPLRAAARASAPSVVDWRCARCTYINAVGTYECEMCSASPEHGAPGVSPVSVDAPQAAGGFGAPAAASQSSGGFSWSPGPQRTLYWTCASCRTVNADVETACGRCAEPRTSSGAPLGAANGAPAVAVPALVPAASFAMPSVGFVDIEHPDAFPPAMPVPVAPSHERPVELSVPGGIGGAHAAHGTSVVGTAVWACPLCTFASNAVGAHACEMCGIARVEGAPSGEVVDLTLASSSPPGLADRWRCSNCASLNDEPDQACASCAEPRVGSASWNLVAASSQPASMPAPAAVVGAPNVTAADTCQLAVARLHMLHMRHMYHQSGVAHGDISLENAFVGSQEFRVIDLPAARVLVPSAPRALSTRLHPDFSFAGNLAGVGAGPARVAATAPAVSVDRAPEARGGTTVTVTVRPVFDPSVAYHPAHAAAWAAFLASATRWSRDDDAALVRYAHARGGPKVLAGAFDWPAIAPGEVGGGGGTAVSAHGVGRAVRGGHLVVEDALTFLGKASSTHFAISL